MKSSPGGITRFTKIKFDGSKVLLEYHVTRPGGGDPDEFAVHSSDKPLASFSQAQQELVVDVCHICEFPLSEASKFTVRGVSLSYKDGILGAVITSLKTVMAADAPLVINTPYLPEKAPGEAGGCTLSLGTGRRLRAFMAEAERYLRGERMQGSLFDGTDSPAAPPSRPRAGGVEARA